MKVMKSSYNLFGDEFAFGLGKTIFLLDDIEKLVTLDEFHHHVGQILENLAGLVN